MYDSTRTTPYIILHAEDDADHAEFIEISLRDNKIPHIIKLVKDGEEALDYIFRRGIYSDSNISLTPDLILLDLRMPKVDGFAVLKEIKSQEHLKHIPVVILSSSSALNDIEICYKNHANSFIVKPMDFDEFVVLINDVVTYWLGWNCSLNEKEI